MAAHARSTALRHLLLLTTLIIMAMAGTTSAQLSTGFYSTSCPGLYSAVKPVVRSAIANEKRVGASIVRTP
ncbi:unnamed protein product [Miscanthus lutarioriparius]|uniref:Peroxidase n=1 Tax=Miscanthus lutarioriparius TaxID=422564 RepID=A0A811RG90_9POAL|nr:unnamed protein product [Miscanthus lutarioriparius]